MNVFIESSLILLFILKICSCKNVIILLADDGGFEIGAYGNKIVQTPNLDSLAKKSLIFNKAFTSVSSCSPSRSTILTGLPAHQNGMYGLHHGVHNFNSLETVKSLPNILSNHGITTGIIGKKHVGPHDVYRFDFAETEETNSIMQVGRNITHMKLLARQFLSSTKKKPFFLYIGFHDPHRCGHSHPEFGNFCERFGNGEPGMGHIPDWTPIIYRAEDVEMPYYVQDTLAARQDIAAQYTTMSRLDTGIGLILEEVKQAGLEDETLIIYSSDNGIPFPAGRTNIYDSGSAVPLLISSPDKNTRKNEVTQCMTSLMDLTPTVLDWFNIKPSAKSKLSGNSLLPLLMKEISLRDAVFFSHTLHEVTMYYPIRAIRTKQYKLIHNLNFEMPFPIDQDLFVSPTFQDLLNNTRAKRTTYWYRTLRDYYFRTEWELYDLKSDPEEVVNVIHKPTYNVTLKMLQLGLHHWQLRTEDPWICGTRAVLENSTCYSLNDM